MLTVVDHVGTVYPLPVPVSTTAPTSVSTGQPTTFRVLAVGNLLVGSRLRLEPRVRPASPLKYLSLDINIGLRGKNGIRYRRTEPRSAGRGVGEA